jgi:glycosyltransferase involved in cell wall biosynthesis/tetratricopeptide (TPR) repeat protein
VGKRFLFGPVDGYFAAENLDELCSAGVCLTFNATGEGVDLAVGPNDCWESVVSSFPNSWQPDFIALSVGYNSVQPALFQTPVPLVALATDWNFQWHWYRHLLPHCELVLTDAAGIAVMRREGLDHVRYANLYGPGRALLDMADDEVECPRDIDVLFVGNMQPAVQRHRLKWLTRLGKLADRWNVVIRTGVFGEEYRALLRRSRIVFNRSVRGECNQRAFEAACGGALLLQEAENQEIEKFFESGKEYVTYSESNLEERLIYYLEREDERHAIASEARRRVRDYGFAQLWYSPLEKLCAEDWTGLCQRALLRSKTGPLHDLVARTWQAVGSRQKDPAFLGDLKTAFELAPGAASALNARGVISALYCNPKDAATAALAHFRDSVAADAGNVLAALNLLECELAHGNRAAVIDGAKRLLARVGTSNTINPAIRDTCHFPPIFDHFRVEWENVAWRNAGDPAGESREKANLLRWRLHSLLGDLTEDLSQFYEAALAWPDLSVSRAALGCALGRLSRPAEAATHLELASRDDPFDASAARAFAQSLIDSGDGPGFAQFARQRRLLAKAAPGLASETPIFSGVVDRVRESAPAPVRILWEGPFLDRNSFGLTNRSICVELKTRGHALTVVRRDRNAPPEGPSAQVSELIAGPDLIAAAQPDVHVRMEWPPRFDPPAVGHWVVFQPWEFGSLPREWLRPLAELADEVWAPSWFVRDSFVSSGIPPERVHVVPLGIDPEILRPGVEPFQLKTTKRFKFLFVGGTIHRKGFDFLLKAYNATFSHTDNVCLVVKEVGDKTFYHRQTAEKAIAESQARANAPEIEYLVAELSDSEIAGLYAACDCLVLPYRGEGFGLPVAEAMACGLPVIVTDYGAVLDFCDSGTSYLVPAHVRRFGKNRVGAFETVGEPWLAEPDAKSMCSLLRRVVNSPEESRSKGVAAAARVRSQFTWAQTADVVEARVRALREQPVRRFARAGPAASPHVSVLPQAAVIPSAIHSSSVAEPRSRPRVSLCMIVKNEEANLGECLASAAGLFEETIVVDTGSADATKLIAVRHGARIFDFNWCDSFAAARNESLRHASGDWIFWLDADDRIDEENRAKLKSLFAKLGDDNAAYVMKCLCVPDSASGTATVVDHVRLFRNRPDLRWTYRVHEQILPALRRTGAEVLWSDVVIRHTGYQDPALRRRKLERDLRILRLEIAELPDDPFTLFNFGQVAQELGQYAEAIPLLRRSLERSHVKDSIVRKLYALIAGCHRQLGQPGEALIACREGRTHYPDDAELLFVEAILLRERGELAAAEACLRLLLSVKTDGHFASIDAGLKGYKTRQNLAVLCQQQGRYEEAESFYRQVIEEQPAFLPALVGLADLCLLQKRWSEVEVLAARLNSSRSGVYEGSLLTARLRLALGQFDSALTVLEEIIAGNPRAVQPRVLLSHVLLQHGTDPDAAERALLAVLELAPEHVEARNNLAVLRQEREVHSVGAESRIIGATATGRP